MNINPFRRHEDHSSNTTGLPREIDWREMGAVTPVRDQGDGCRFCSQLFSAVSSHMIHYGYRA